VRTQPASNTPADLDMKTYTNPLTPTNKGLTSHLNMEDRPMTFRSVLVTLMAMLLAAGCVQKKQPLAESDTADVAAEAAASAEPAVAGSEAELVDQLLVTRADYQRLLQVMIRFYTEHGYHDKCQWAKRELKDIGNIRTRNYLAGGPQTTVARLTDLSKTKYQEVNLQTANEIDFVEQLLTIRADYMSQINALAELYSTSGQGKKASWAVFELKDLEGIRSHDFLRTVDVTDLPERSTVAIVEAEDMFQRAQKLRKAGIILPFMNDKTKLREALVIYKDIIKKYPQSTVAPDSAYYAGEILKEYLNEDLQALEYYKIALKLNPDIRRKVRFQLAVIYDFRLHERAEAMKYYNRVLDEEQGIDQSNTDFAGRRIGQLLAEEDAIRRAGAAEETQIESMNDSTEAAPSEAPAAPEK
jgi:tetratricopeptide (TPR) repeat protein